MQEGLDYVKDLGKKAWDTMVEHPLHTAGVALLLSAGGLAMRGRLRNTARIAEEMGLPSEASLLSGQAERAAHPILASERTTLLRGMDLRAFNLGTREGQAAERAILSFSHMDLRGTRFGTAVTADFSYAKMQRASLVDTDLRGSSFWNADMTGADLRRVTMCPGTELSHANLSRARLDGASMPKVRAQHTNFSDASLKDTDLYRAQLYQAKFDRVDLRKTNFIQDRFGWPWP